MKQTRLGWRMVSRVAVVALTLSASPVMAGNEAEVAEHLIELVKIGRGVLSEQMKNINDPAKADKGFTGDYMSMSSARSSALKWPASITSRITSTSASAWVTVRFM